MGVVTLGTRFTIAFSWLFIPCLPRVKTDDSERVLKALQSLKPELSGDFRFDEHDWKTGQLRSVHQCRLMRIPEAARTRKRQRPKGYLTERLAPMHGTAVRYNR